MTASISDFELVVFDDVRTNLHRTSENLAVTVKELQKRDAKGDEIAGAALKLYRGLYLIVEAEQKYRLRDFIGSEEDFSQSAKLLTKFTEVGTFPAEYIAEAERLILFAKGRQIECSAQKEDLSLEEQATLLRQAASCFADELKKVKLLDRPLLIYNAKSRVNFTQALAERASATWLETEAEFTKAKKKHLTAYRLFALAAYYNPSLRIWIKEQDYTLKLLMKNLLVKRASDLWSQAFQLSSNGQFQKSSKKCSLASALFKRASKLSREQIEAKELLSNAYLLQASMHEANANAFLKKQNNPNQAAYEFELAAQFILEALTANPSKDASTITQRLKAQQQYYYGNFNQCQGIFQLDAEKYKEALELFQQAEVSFAKALDLAVLAQESTLKTLVEKASAEVKGYIGMCRTVLD